MPEPGGAEAVTTQTRARTLLRVLFRGLTPGAGATQHLLRLARLRGLPPGPPAERGAGLPSQRQAETGQVLTGCLCRHGEAGCGVVPWLGTASWTRLDMGPWGLPAGSPRRLRGSCDTEFRCPERGLAAVGAPPACRPTGLLGFSSLQGLGGLAHHAVWGLQQLQHPPHLQRTEQERLWAAPSLTRPLLRAGPRGRRDKRPCL